MKDFISRRPRLLKGILVLTLLIPSSLVLHGCTDLGEDTFGIVTPDQFYETDEQIISALAPVYSLFRALLWNYHNLSQVSSDETLVPTRGSDWFDGGRWLAIHRHTWDPGLSDLNGAWIESYTGIARANGLLQILEEAGNTDAALNAEIRTLRAFYYFLLLDLFGNVPIVGDDEYVIDAENPPPTESRATVYNFVVSELTAAVSDLPAQWSGSNQGRITKGAANAMLATLYLNANVFTKNSSEINTSGPNPCGQSDCQNAVAAADAVINSGLYSLLSDFHGNFAVANANSPEFVMEIQHLSQPGLGMNFQMRPLHYNQGTPSPWNGFSTLAHVYNAFDENDVRKDIFLIGRAVNYETGDEVNDRQDNPLIFTPEINNVEDATEGEGIRILKFPFDVDNAGGNHGNDYGWWRLSEMYLIKAEALNEMNGPTQEVVNLINLVRERAFDPDQPIALSDYPDKASMRQRIMDERLFELTYEARRRQDLIRAGQFTAPWEFKERHDGHLVLFPIPQTQLDANPNLTQNPGY